MQAANLRRYTLENKTILNIDSFPERDNKKKRVFESVKMSVCIVLIKSCIPHSDYRIPVSIWDDKNMLNGICTSFNYNEIKKIDSEGLTIPRLREEEIPLIIKLLNKREIKLKCIEGELNMTFHKKYFGADKNNPAILKGAAIQKFRYTFNMSQGEIEYLDESRYTKECGSSEKSKHHLKERIAMQGMTGANDEVRLIMAVVPKGLYLANSCNYILPPPEIDIYTLLAILNSKALNWFFRRFSTNSNVNGYEVDNFPIVCADNKISKRLSYLAKEASKADDQALIKICDMIDLIVYKLYGLTFDDVLLIEPKISLYREEYNSFNLEDIRID